MENKLLFNSLAKLLTYPQEEYSVYCRTALNETERLSNSSSEKKEILSNAFANLEIFTSQIAVKSQSQREELFTQSFDINPIGNLEVGWHLYGEQYERGAFLVECRNLLREYRIEESVELPDHLSHLLLLVGEMDLEKGNNFTEKNILPAMEKILLKFQTEENPFKHLLLSIKEILIAQFEIGVNHA